MVRTLNDNNVLLLRRHPRQLDRCLDSLGARVPEEEAVERRVGHDGQ